MSCLSLTIEVSWTWILLTLSTHQGSRVKQTHQSKHIRVPVGHSFWTSVSGFLIINIFKYKDDSFEQMIEFEMFQHIYTVLYINLNHFKRIQYYKIKVSYFVSSASWHYNHVQADSSLRCNNIYIYLLQENLVAILFHLNYRCFYIFHCIYSA